MICEEMEMPTPCEHCGDLFDLNDGYGSEKWHPNIVICEKCYAAEQSEIEDDDYWEGVNIEVSNALYSLDTHEGTKTMLSPENKAQILKVAELLKSSEDEN